MNFKTLRGFLAAMVAVGTVGQTAVVGGRGYDDGSGRYRRSDRGYDDGSGQYRRSDRGYKSKIQSKQKP